MAYAILTALLINFLLGPWLIEKLKRYPANSTIRDYVPHNGAQKASTPTMGGIIILISMIGSTLLWANLNNPYIWLILGMTTGMGLVGLVDDIMKIKGKSHKGLRGWKKIFWQFIIALAGVYFLFTHPANSVTTSIPIPFLKYVHPDLGMFYIGFAVLVIIGTSNAVNLTDGLDGLAIGPTVIATLAFIILSYISGHIVFANYLMIPYVPGSGELSVFCGAMLGAGLGFLWYNSYPASVFMGDMGSLSLGGALGTLAVITKNELLLVIIGGVFVMETLSVIIQVASFKLLGGRGVFRMTPIHHHFELRGWAEPKIVVRFWIIAVILALISLSTLKLR